MIAQPRSRLLYSAIILLVSVYSFAAFLAFHPDVSDAYAAYYIFRTTNLTIREQGRVRPLAVGEQLPASSPVIAFDGWDEWNGTARRNARRDPTIIFTIGRDATEIGALCMRLGVTAPIAPVVTAQLNGVAADVAASGAQIEVTLPMKALVVGENVLSFRAPTRTGLSVSWLHFAPLP